MDYIHSLRPLIGSRKIILNCAGALIIREGRVLFQRRSDNGKWGLIGGLLELNETYEEAALREIREETGLEVKLTSFLGIFHNHHMVWSNGDTAHVISAVFTAGIISGTPRIDEESYELRFFGKDELPDLFALYDQAKPEGVAMAFAHGSCDSTVKVEAAIAFTDRFRYPLTIFPGEEHTISDFPESPIRVAQLAAELYTS